jgi:hypothetical protein
MKRALKVKKRVYEFARESFPEEKLSPWDELPWGPEEMEKRRARNRRKRGIRG